jgi:hypothetical protein
MHFELISTIGLTAGAAIMAASLSVALAQTIRGRLQAAVAIAAWFAIVVVLGATEALGPQYSGGVIGLGVAVLLPTVLLGWAFLATGPIRQAMTAVPLPALIAVHAVRLLGILFVLLYVADRLPAPFAPAAGWGDVFIGATAGPVAWLAVRRDARGLMLAWNLLGFLDLVDAVGLGATSSPGPIRLFLDPPGSGIMTTLPWILIPCFLVPILLALHVAIFDRLYRDGAVASLFDRARRMPATPG